MFFKRRIFLLLATLMVLGTIFSTFITSVFVYFEIGAIVESRVKETALAISTVYDTDDLYRLKNITANIKDIRIIITDNKNEILYDSNYNDSRETIYSNSKTAKYDPKTADEKYDAFEDLYYKTIRVNKNFKLTVVTSGDSIVTIFLDIFWKVLIIFSLFLINGLIIFKVFIDKLIKNIISIDPEKPVETNKYNELKPLANKLSEKNSIIENQLASIRKSNLQLELIIEHSPKGIIITDDDGIIVFINNIVKDDFKIKDDVIGKSFFDYFKDDVFRKVYSLVIERSSDVVNMDFNNKSYIWTIVNISSEITNNLNIKETESHGSILYIEKAKKNSHKNIESSNAKKKESEDVSENYSENVSENNVVNASENDKSVNNENDKENYKDSDAMSSNEEKDLPEHNNDSIIKIENIDNKNEEKNDGVIKTDSAVNDLNENEVNMSEEKESKSSMLKHDDNK